MPRADQKPYYINPWKCYDNDSKCQCQCKCHKPDPEPEKLRCYCDKALPGDSEIQKLYCELRPPNIAGKWIISFCYLRQKTFNQEVSFKDIRSETAKWDVEQKGVFIISKYYANEIQPQDTVRLGVWRPTYKDGKVVNWELYLADADDSEIMLFQVVKSDHDQPIILQTTGVESGFNENNPDQVQAVLSGFAYRDPGCH